MTPPPATFQGTIQAPGPYDPYGPPGAATQPLLPTDPFAQSPSPFGLLQPMPALRQEITLDYHWLARLGSQPFGTNDADLHGTFAFPFLYNRETPLLITPGFAVHLWDGPVSTGPDSATSPDLPPIAYDAYVSAAWHPQPTTWLSGDIEFRMGAYTDFTQTTTEIIRFPSHGLAILAFSPSFQVVGGVYYLDRNHIKLLPGFGVIWIPNRDTRFEILFPNPKISKRLATLGTTDWWLYGRGEYGGGAWRIERSDGTHNSVDYNDIRVAVGVESERGAGLHGGFEVGLAFNREIYYRETPGADIYPTPTVFLGGSVGF
jgi:hypothetical protein